MFTGLIEEVGTIKGASQSNKGRLIQVYSEFVIRDLKNGDSVTINGACQTVTDLSHDFFTVYASPVTCSVTTLGNMGQGEKVNLERAVSPSSRFGGHFVQGHVDGTGVIAGIEKDSDGLSAKVSADNAIMKYIVEKGSVAIDGISLTVVAVTGSVFSVYIIPETLKNTNMVMRKKGDMVNIETDIFAKYIERFMKTGTQKDDKDRSLKNKLFEEGFM